MKQDNNSLSHTTYNCKYHIVIVPKYRRAVIYNKLRTDIIVILKTLIERKPGLRLLEGEGRATRCPYRAVHTTSFRRGHDYNNIKYL